MPDYIRQFLTSAVASMFFSGSVIWLFRSWISERLKNAIAHEYNQKLETHKAQLKASSDVELEQLKAKLQISASERNIKLTNIFDKQAETVTTIYKHLVNLKDATTHCIFCKTNSDIAGELPMEKTISQIRTDFYTYFSLNKIYLPRETALAISNFESTVSREKLRFDLYNDVFPKGNPERTKSQMEIYGKVTEDIPKLLELLEEDFQKILGVSMLATK